MSCCDCDFCEELPDGRLLCDLYDEIVGHANSCDEYQSGMTDDDWGDDE